MTNEFRSYIENQPEELLNLQKLAAESGMEVFVEVNENFPSNFIDTIHFLASISKKFKISPLEINSMTESFIKNKSVILKKLSTFKPSIRPHEVTTSFLLTAIIANKHRENLSIEDLQSFGWHVDAAKIVLEING